MSARHDTEHGRRFRQRLDRCLAAVRLRRIAVGLFAWVSGGALLVAWVALVLGRIADPSSGVKAGAGLLLLAGLAWLLRDVLLEPLRAVGGRRRFTAALDAAAGARSLLVAALEVQERPERWHARPVSSALAERISTRADALAAGLGPSDLPAPVSPGRVLAVGLCTVLLALGGWTLTADTSGRGLSRLLAPLRPESVPPSSGLFLDGAAHAVVAGDSLQLAALDFGSPLGPVVCEIRRGTGEWEPTEAVELPRWPSGPSRRFARVLDDVNEDLDFRFGRDGLWSGIGRVRVLQPPLLTQLAVRVTPPAYTGLPVERRERAPAVLEAPAGSRLTWSGRSTQALAAAVLVSTDGDTLPWIVQGDSLTGEWRVDRDLAWSLLLTNTEGLAGRDAVQRQVRVRPDEAPHVTLRDPLGDGTLPGDGRLTLLGDAEDDYGLDRLQLLLRREEPGAAPDENWSRLELDAAAPRHGTELGPVGLSVAPLPGDTPPLRRVLGLDLDVGALDLRPGESLLVALEARDTRRPDPRGTGRSPVLRYRLPSAAELLAGDELRGEERQAGLDSLRLRGESLAADLDRLRRELMKDPLTDHARRQEIEDTVARQEDLQQELETLTESLRRDLEDLAARNLTSTELVERMDRIAEMLDELKDPRLEALRRRMEEAVGELSDEEIRQAVEEAARNQEETLERLDRAIELLQEMRREQELAGLASRAEEMLREQQDLMDPAAGEDAEAAAERQEALAEAADALAEDLQQALDELMERAETGQESPSDEALREALEQALQELDEDALQELQKQSAQEMRSGEKPQGGSDSQHEAMRRLAALYHALMQGQQSMQANMENYSAEIMRRLAFDLLGLSRRQETLAGQIPPNLHAVRAPRLARDQRQIQRAAQAMRNRLEGALGASATPAMKLLGELDKVTEGLSGVVVDLEAGRGQGAVVGARNGLAALNRLVMNLLTTAAMTGGGGSGSMPMPALSQQLEQMAREQAGLNGLTQQLRDQLGMSQEQRAGMQRLQGEQSGLAGRLRESAEQERNRPEGERLLGDLDEIARDMERVVDDLADGAVDEETLRRQERILGRLLDAHNSVRKRDYSRRRESETAAEVLARQRGVGPDAADAGESPWQLRYRDVQRVPAEYRDLVRRYFDRLRALEDGEGGP